MPVGLFEQKETKLTKAVALFVCFVSFCGFAGVLSTDGPICFRVYFTFFAATFPGQRQAGRR